MKIAFLHHSFIIGSGIDSLIYQYAKRLSVEHEVEIFTFRSYYKLDTQLWKINVIDFPYAKTRMGSGVFAPLFMPWGRIRDELEKFDVVVAQLYPANLIPVLPTKLKTKVVMIEWGTPSGVWNRWQERAYARLAEGASKIACRKADKVLVSSRYVQNYVKEKYGVDSHFLWIDGLDFGLLDKNKFESTDNHNILYVGRISPHKNIHTLIRAFRRIKHEISDATLTIVGSHTFPEYSRELRQLTKRLNLGSSVKWVGKVSWEALPKYYADCAVYCSPSLWEGFMRCEAFAFEKPMVVFNTTANAETVHDFEDGIVVQQQTPEALANALVLLLNDERLRKDMGYRGYKWAKKCMDLDKITKGLLHEFAT